MEGLLMRAGAVAAAALLLAGCSADLGRECARFAAAVAGAQVRQVGTAIERDVPVTVADFERIAGGRISALEHLARVSAEERGLAIREVGVRVSTPDGEREQLCRFEVRGGEVEGNPAELVDDRIDAIEVDRLTASHFGPPERSCCIDGFKPAQLRAAAAP